jgi:hypothetical protein
MAPPSPLAAASWDSQLAEFQSARARDLAVMSELLQRAWAGRSVAELSGAEPSVVYTAAGTALLAWLVICVLMPPVRRAAWWVVEPVIATALILVLATVAIGMPFGEEGGGPGGQLWREGRWGGGGADARERGHAAGMPGGAERLQAGAAAGGLALCYWVLPGSTGQPRPLPHPLLPKLLPPPLPPSSKGGHPHHPTHTHSRPPPAQAPSTSASRGSASSAPPCSTPSHTCVPGLRVQGFRVSLTIQPQNPWPCLPPSPRPWRSPAGRSCPLLTPKP